METARYLGEKGEGQRHIRAWSVLGSTDLLGPNAPGLGK